MSDSIIEPTLPILVVDDTRFSAAFMVQALEKQGYRNVRSAGSGKVALEQIGIMPASILLVDWMMPEMDGLELCRQVREKDQELAHFTYIILITGKDSPQAILEAFGSGVDDFIDKNRLKSELVPRVFAAGRIANLQNKLLEDNASLADNQERRRDGIEIDPVSGLGNARYAALRLKDALLQCDGRGGQVWYLLMGVANAQALIDKHGDSIYAEIVEEMTRRTKHLVRPLDFVARLAFDQFAVICYVEREERELVSALKRVHETMNHKEIRTEAGFLDITIGTTLVVLTQKYANTTPEEVMQSAASPLQKSLKSNLFESCHWPLDDVANTSGDKQS